jgi:hypothetical protein
VDDITDSRGFRPPPKNSRPSWPTWPSLRVASCGRAMIQFGGARPLKFKIFMWKVARNRCWTGERRRHCLSNID